MVPLANPSLHPKCHLDWFSHFAGLTIVTNLQTDHATPSVTTGCIYVVLRCGHIVIINVPPCDRMKWLAHVLRKKENGTQAENSDMCAVK